MHGLSACQKLGRRDVDQKEAACPEGAVNQKDVVADHKTVELGIGSG